MVNLSLSCNTNRRNMYGALDVGLGGHFESLYLCVNVFVCFQEQNLTSSWTADLNTNIEFIICQP